MDLVQEGQVLLISNARIDMFKGSMRLAVGQNGSIEESSEKLADKVNVGSHTLKFLTVAVTMTQPKIIQRCLSNFKRQAHCKSAPSIIYSSIEWTWLRLFPKLPWQFIESTS